MSLKTIVGQLGASAGQFLALESVLSTLIVGLPLDAQDRERLTGILEQARKLALAAQAGISSISEPKAVTVKQSDVEKVVATLLPALVEKAVADAIAKMTPPASRQSS